jgi:chromate reductase
MAQQHLRNILAYVDVPALGQPEVFVQMIGGLFDAAGQFGNEDTRKFMQECVDRYVSSIRKHSAARLER